MKFVIVALFTLSGIVGCSRDNEIFSGQISGGTYVELIGRRDTIKFNVIDDRNFFHLGSAERNANGWPIYPLGLYSYDKKGDSIRAVWMASSSTNHPYVHFKMSADRKSFTVGNFYKFDSPQKIIQFIRIR